MSKNFDEIIKSIETMSVLELSELVKTLEEKFGVSAAAMSAPSAGPAANDDSAEKKEEKSEYKVTLEEMGSEKIKVIKAIKQTLALGLAEAKKIVESAPVTLLETAPKEDAEKIKKILEEVGAKVKLS